MADVAVVIPTITGREHWLDRCLTAYERTTPASWSCVIVRDEPTCGRAWNVGIARALDAHPEISYLHLTADDIEPLAGWYEAAAASADRGELPAPRILNPDGTLQSCGDEHERPEGTQVEIARIPFATVAQMRCIGQIIETHYYTDNYFSFRGRECGYPSKVVRAYSLVHHLAPEGRKDALLVPDHRAYMRATA